MNIVQVNRDESLGSNAGMQRHLSHGTSSSSS
jgi:hypothetical protein